MRRTNKRFLSGVVLGAALGLPLVAVSAEPGRLAGEIVAQAGAEKGGGKESVSPDARKFIEEAAMGSLLEVQLGQLADDNAESDEVRQFGKRMVQDHGKASSELLQVTESLGASLPKELDAKHKEKVTRLQKLKGKEFDRAYMKEMVQAHEKDVASFRKQSEGGKNPELKQFASSTLPTLQEHLKMAQELSKKVQGGGK